MAVTPRVSKLTFSSLFCPFIFMCRCDHDKNQLFIDDDVLWTNIFYFATSFSTPYTHKRSVFHMNSWAHTMSWKRVAENVLRANKIWIQLLIRPCSWSSRLLVIRSFAIDRGLEYLWNYRVRIHLGKMSSNFEDIFKPKFSTASISPENIPPTRRLHWNWRKNRIVLYPRVSI